MRMESVKTRISQLELGLVRSREPDRNHQHGGRSFYFFDLDDNVFFLKTKIYAFHKQSGKEVALTSGDWAEHHADIGKSGPFKDYFIDFDPVKGSFRRFRDLTPDRMKELGRTEQPFHEDIKEGLALEDFKWQGPSWKFFYHAIFNGRPISIITARGHHSDTLKGGIQIIKKAGLLAEFDPNYIGVFPVTNPYVRSQLGDAEEKLTVAELKRLAIMESVQSAMRIYGENPYHRFGMSDDDPKNVDLIAAAMKELKRTYPENGFFVISTHNEIVSKREIFVDHEEISQMGDLETQLPLI